ncbi:uncharacterized protein ASPGLDRAFT_85848 [Aspergillus glaucus CBS 516.65]|uniref:Peptidase S8/S53 domain-containing protein n=1 Tax=Aspergillus glaucus CBS 516.65 TaxID=1160497 RepID=A0A1L9V662_ASPGL|nr:hypothetical protein ASPGLDRAFT_85848 [Aspergillus glaucus CBS 516.65]OJJ79396.1 hypothetical protein ASPGLDRAFT_85848 [Aspergillus glaucus CBS 516.65]
MTLQPLTARTGLSNSSMQGLVPAATMSRDTWDQRRKENADHLEAVLKWLKDTKGVKQIIKLVVRDDKDGPCSDEVIERCLKIYDIRYLDWQKEDICVQTLLEGQAKNLVEVSLYSSGKDSTLWSWSSNDGLHRLEKLKKVILNINPDGIETVERTKRNAEHFKKRVEEIPERQIQVNYHIDPPRGLEDPSSDKDQKIEDGHGTAMATYIQFVCPGVRLYVAKLDPESQETRAASAAEAVKWAIKRKVHVISMSWTVEITKKNEKQIKAFEAQIREAASRNIIMFCSGRDEAWNESSKSSYPAGSDTKKVYRVGSSDLYDNMFTWVNAGNIDYLLPGEALFPGDKLRGDRIEESGCCDEIPEDEKSYQAL